MATPRPQRNRGAAAPGRMLRTVRSLVAVGAVVFAMSVSACGGSAENGRVVAVDLASHRVQWAAKAASYGTDASAEAGGAVMAQSFGVLQALDAETGKERWRAHVDNDFGLIRPRITERGLQPAVVMNAGVLAKVIQGGEMPQPQLLMLSIADGSVLWQSDMASDAAAGSDSIHVVRRQGDGASSLVTLDAQTGRARWATPLSRDPGLLTPLDNVVTVAGSAGELSAFSADSGERRWSVTVEGSTAVDPFAEHRGLILALVRVGEQVPPETAIIALDAETGREAWRYVNTPWFIAIGPELVDGTVLAMAAPDRLVALDAGSGAMAWEVRSERQREGSPGQLEISEGVVYVVSHSSRSIVEAVDLASGALLWRQDFKGSKSLLAVYGGGELYLHDGRSLRALDAATGQTTWWVPLAGQATHIAKSADGRRLFVSFFGRAPTERDR